MKVSLTSSSSSYLERVWDYWVLPFNMRATHVSTINAQRRTIHPVNPYRPHLRFNRLTDKLLFAAVVLVLFLLDDAIFSVLLKLWLFLLFTVCYLFLHDHALPVRYYHPSRPKKRIAKHGIPNSINNIKYRHGTAFSNPTTTSSSSASSSDSIQYGFCSIRQCDFAINKVKLTTDGGICDILYM